MRAALKSGAIAINESNEEKLLLMYKLIAIALLPSTEIATAVAGIKGNTPHTFAGFNELFAHVDKVWLEDVKPQHFTVYNSLSRMQNVMLLYESQSPGFSSVKKFIGISITLPNARAYPKFANVLKDCFISEKIVDINVEAKQQFLDGKNGLAANKKYAVNTLLPSTFILAQWRRMSTEDGLQSFLECRNIFISKFAKTLMQIQFDRMSLTLPNSAPTPKVLYRHINRRLFSSSSGTSQSTRQAEESERQLSDFPNHNFETSTITHGSSTRNFHETYMLYSDLISSIRNHFL